MLEAPEGDKQTIQCSGNIFLFLSQILNTTYCSQNTVFESDICPMNSVYVHLQGVSDMLASQGVKKSQAEKALDALADKGSIVRKEFGKTKIYFPSQEGIAELEPEVNFDKSLSIIFLSFQVELVSTSNRIFSHRLSILTTMIFRILLTGEDCQA